jgi:DnaK suppressor protein
VKKRTARTEEGGNEAYRRMLLDRRAQVLSNLGVRFDTLALAGRVAEEDQAQICHDEFVSLRLNSLDYEQLGLVEAALDRIQSGEYGVCLACGDPIPAKRLGVVPWARCCVPCQERASDLAGEPETDAAEVLMES